MRSRGQPTRMLQDKSLIEGMIRKRFLILLIICYRGQFVMVRREVLKGYYPNQRGRAAVLPSRSLHLADLPAVMMLPCPRFIYRSRPSWTYSDISGPHSFQLLPRLVPSARHLAPSFGAPHLYLYLAHALRSLTDYPLFSSSLTIIAAGLCFSFSSHSNTYS